MALSGLLTASVTELPVFWKNFFVLSSAANDVDRANGRAGSSPGVDGANGDISVGNCGRDVRDEGEGGSSWMADSTLLSNSSCVILLRLLASMVSMNAMAPLRLER